MKHSGLILLILLGSTFYTYAQTKDYNQISLELNYGTSIPVSPKTADRSEAIGFTHIKPALRVMFNQKMGIRGFYAYDRFGETNAGLSVHRLGAEWVLNLDDLLNLPLHIRENFGLQTHVGGGLGLLSPHTNTENAATNDFIAFLIIGGGPQVQLSDWLSLYGDLSFNQLFKQSRGFDGRLIDESSGNYVNVSIGIQVSLGENTHHADWY